MKMFFSELLKIRRSKSLKKACAIYAVLVLLCAMGASGEQNLGYSGIRGFFVAFSYQVPWSYWIYAAFSVLLLGGEFDGRLLKNAFACGVSRGKYYAVKVLSVYLPCFFLYLASVALTAAIRTARFGFNPDGWHLEDCLLKAFAFNGLALAVIFAYVSLFNLFCIIFRSSGLPFICALALTWLDFMATSLSNKYYGYLKEYPKNLFSVIQRMRDGLKSVDILNPEFLGMYVPCLCVGGISLIAGYVLLKARDVE